MQVDLSAVEQAYIDAETSCELARREAEHGADPAEVARLALAALSAATAAAAAARDAIRRLAEAQRTSPAVE